MASLNMPLIRDRFDKESLQSFKSLAGRATIEKAANEVESVKRLGTLESKMFEREAQV
jgi:hypothetical protein